MGRPALVALEKKRPSKTTTGCGVGWSGWRRALVGLRRRPGRVSVKEGSALIPRGLALILPICGFQDAAGWT